MRMRCELGERGAWEDGEDGTDSTIIYVFQLFTRMERVLTGSEKRGAKTV